MPGGRPTKYDPRFVQIAESMCELGATDPEVAKALNIKVRTLYRWRHEYPEFCHALKVGKDAVDDRIERAMVHKALGYTHDDVHISNYKGHVTITKIKKHYPPDTVAGMFWLTNRRPDKYRKNPEQDNADPAEPLNITFKRSDASHEPELDDDLI